MSTEIFYNLACFWRILLDFIKKEREKKKKKNPLSGRTKVQII